MNLQELTRKLMTHKYFQDHSEMTAGEVLHLLKGVMQARGCTLSELSRACQILLDDEWEYCDPISLLTGDWNFTAGVFTKPDTGYAKKKKQEYDFQASAFRFKDWEYQYNHRYNNDPAFRQDVKIHREKFGAARKNDQGDWEIYDESYHKCWCLLQDGKLYPLKKEPGHDQSN